MTGYIRHHRSTFDHPCFADEPFTEREAWVWMIMEASYKPRVKRTGRHVANLERGQFSASVRFLAEKWGWTKSKVHRFLERLKNRDMIGTETGTGMMVLTISNYDIYQEPERNLGTAGGQQPGQSWDSSGTNLKKDNKYIINNPPISPKGDFDEFWSSVPKKVGKVAAEKAYRKALRGADSQTLLDAMKLYAKTREGQDHQYTVHPATWLNQGRWQDEPPQGKKKASVADLNASQAGLIKSGNPALCRAISDQRAYQLLSSGHVTLEECHAVDLLRHERRG
ncbi:MAG: hypothetical protein AAFR21_17315 [Pseudomonadota bacterium]